VEANSLKIIEDDLKRPEVLALVREHLESMYQTSPPEAVFALEPEALVGPDVTFWTAWTGPNLAGCGALRELDPSHGEIKSMRTSSTHLRQGVASRLLEHILSVSRKRGYHRLSLETGSGPAFTAAQKLYERYGFQPSGPFADYKPNEFSVFMTRTVD